jgi:hypothetical protein
MCISSHKHPPKLKFPAYSIREGMDVGYDMLRCLRLLGCVTYTHKILHCKYLSQVSIFVYLFLFYGSGDVDVYF